MTNKIQNDDSYMQWNIVLNTKMAQTICMIAKALSHNHNQTVRHFFSASTQQNSTKFVTQAYFNPT